MAGYYLISDPTTRELFYNGVGGVCLVAIVIGIRVHRPEHAGSWWLLAGGIGCFVAGDTVWSFYLLRGLDPFPSPADALYLAGYPLLALSLWRSGRARREPALAQLDAAVFVAAGLVPLLQFLILPIVRDSDLELVQTIVSLAYPVADLLLLAVLVRVLLNGSRSSVPLRLFTFGATGMFVADVIFARLEMTDSYSGGTWFDWMWLLTYVCTGAAALHPRMAAMDETDSRAAAHPRWLRLLFLATAAVIAPVLAVSDRSVDVASRVTLTVAATVVAVLVVGRLGMTVRSLDARTRALSDAIVDRESLTERLRHASLHDSLTGLPNREAFAASVRGAVAAGGHHVVAFCDLDEFKAVNDDYGHPAGDRVLAVVAERFRGTMRPDDVVARLGGDEFGLLWRDVPDTDSAQAFADRLLAVLHEPISIGDVIVRIGASVGMTLTGGATREYADLLADADVAVYGAKRSGPGRAVFFEPAMREQVLGPARLAARLAEAIDAGDLTVVFQPVVSTRTRQMMAVEALVRWNDRGVALAPNDFLPVAADHGLIAAVDAFVLSASLELFAGWRDAPTRLHVNASPQFLAQPGVVELVRDALTRSRVSPSRLTLEMTEYAFDGDSGPIVEHCTALRDIGVALALDDFGTGYSSLSYLQRFPFDALKLDISLTALVDRGECPPILRAVVRLGHSLGLRVIAEGVESEAQFTALHAIGCDEVQGFALAVPSPISELAFPDGADPSEFGAVPLH
ncbi:MAG: hypothetical protein JWM93_773 [Frankiales bacterium]|nr:hypothetical protein [Frankiales bacterium]